MGFTEQDVLQYVEENDVKFIRLFFCDIFGVPKNVAVMAEVLPRVFAQGAGFDVSAVDGFMNVAEGDLLLLPDPGTLSILPWRPSTGRVARMFCDIRRSDGTPFSGCGRTLLRTARAQAKEAGLSFRFGTECEFYLFEMDEKGNPTLHPRDKAGYLDIAPLDRCENVRREICLALEEMGLFPEGSHHEKGPGQNEIWCRPVDVLAAADDLITYKSAVRTIAAQNGLFASFMPKPLPGKSGSGLHVHMAPSLLSGDALLEQTLHAFLAGILRRVGDMTLFLNTATNSYQRFGSFEAPRYVTWSSGNRAQLIRVPETGAPRLELRSPDPLCNPYLAFTLLLQAGLEGLRNGSVPPVPTDIDLQSAPAGTLAGLERLPDSLGAAIEKAQDSIFVRQSLPAPVIGKILEVKRNEWERYNRAEDKNEFEHACYFERV